MTDKELSAANGVLEHEIKTTLERLETSKTASQTCPQHGILVDGQILSIRICEQTLRVVTRLSDKVPDTWGKIGFGKFQASGKAVLVFGGVAVIALMLWFRSASADEKATAANKVVVELSKKINW